MDRHEFVKTLIGQRDSARAELSTIQNQIAAAKRRTKEAVLDWEGNNIPVHGMMIDGLSGSFSRSIEELLPESLRVTDNDIIALAAQISTLEASIGAAKKELESLKQRDFVAHLKALLG